MDEQFGHQQDASEFFILVSHMRALIEKIRNKAKTASKGKELADEADQAYNLLKGMSSIGFKTEIVCQNEHHNLAEVDENIILKIQRRNNYSPVLLIDCLKAYFFETKFPACTCSQNVLNCNAYKCETCMAHVEATKFVWLRYLSSQLLVVCLSITDFRQERVN